MISVVKYLYEMFFCIDEKRLKIETQDSSSFNTILFTRQQMFDNVVVLKMNPRQSVSDSTIA